MLILELITIGFLIAYLMDRLFVVDGIYRYIIYILFLIFGQKIDKKKITIRKPFSCSFCMIFWLSLIYAYLYTNIGLIYLLLISITNAIMSVNYLHFYDIMTNLLTKLLQLLENKIFK